MRVSIWPEFHLSRLVPLAIAVIAFNACSPLDAGQSRAFADPKDGFKGSPETYVDDFEAYTQRLGFGEVTGSVILDERFPCPDKTKCGGQDSVHLRVVPSNYAPTVQWDQALGTGNGHIVAKIINTDTVAYDPLKLAKSDIAYLWVGGMNGVPKGAAIYRVRGGKLTRLYKFSSLKFCKGTNGGLPAVHSNRPPKCTDTDPKPLSAAQQASIFPVGALLDGLMRALNGKQALTGGLWISCSVGCCEAIYGS